MMHDHLEYQRQYYYCRKVDNAEIKNVREGKFVVKSKGEHCAGFIIYTNKDFRDYVDKCCRNKDGSLEEVLVK